MSADDTSGATAAASETEQTTRRYTGAAAHTAAWGLVFVILRIFAVSNYDWETAFLVSTTLGFDDALALLFGSLMAGHLLTALLLMVVLPLLIGAYLWGLPDHRPTVMLLTTLGTVILVALTVTFHSWWLPLATGAVLAVFLLVHRLPSENALQRFTVRAMGHVAWVAGVSVLLVAAFVQTPWVPYEEIRTTNGTISGYVLSVDPGYLNVLTEDQQFVILISSDVLSRR